MAAFVVCGLCVPCLLLLLGISIEADLHVASLETRIQDLHGADRFRCILSKDPGTSHSERFEGRVKVYGFFAYDSYSCSVTVARLDTYNNTVGTYGASVFIGIDTSLRKDGSRWCNDTLVKPWPNIRIGGFSAGKGWACGRMGDVWLGGVQPTLHTWGSPDDCLFGTLANGSIGPCTLDGSGQLSLGPKDLRLERLRRMETTWRHRQYLFSFLALAAPTISFLLCIVAFHKADHKLPADEEINYVRLDF